MKTHDYRNRYWGHDYVWEPKNGGQSGALMGWGNGIERGDYVIFGPDQGARYKVTSIRYFCDPRDMFTAQVVFKPRTPKEVEDYESKRPKPLATMHELQG